MKYHDLYAKSIFFLYLYFLSTPDSQQFKYLEMRFWA